MKHIQKKTIEEFFKKFKEDNFYVEEKINGGYEVKYYYVKGNIYSKGDSIIEKSTDFYVYNKVKFPMAVRLLSNLYMWREATFLIIQ